MIEASFIESVNVSNSASQGQKINDRVEPQSEFSNVFEQKLNEIDAKSRESKRDNKTESKAESRNPLSEIEEASRETLEKESKLDKKSDKFDFNKLKKSVEQLVENGSLKKEANKLAEDSDKLSAGIAALKAESLKEQKKLKDSTNPEKITKAEKEKLSFKEETIELSELDLPKIKEESKQANPIPLETKVEATSILQDNDLNLEIKADSIKIEKTTQSADKKIEITDLRDFFDIKKGSASEKADIRELKPSAKEDMVFNLEKILDADTSPTTDKKGFIQKFDNFLKAEGMQEIVTKAKFILKNNDRGEINLHLRPENLGNVKISMQLNDNSITGKIIVENLAVRQLFESNMLSLQKAFEEKGFTFGNFELSYGGEDSQQKEHQSRDNHFFNENNILKTKTSVVEESFDRLSIYQDGYKKIDMVI
ncbi:MAG: flagellar hook-length control protein FliK [Spirochaetales bacterium]|nr:flagellar hook-length control protein FliK [Spirochaetales bacterium]